MYNDLHVHFRGSEHPDRVLRALDDARIEKIGAISPPPRDPQQPHAAVADMKRILDAGQGRLYGLAWINPLLPGAADLVERAVAEYGYRGVKMIPDHWYPYDERVFPVYERVQTLGVPMLLHSGILWGNRDSSRFCQPVNYEVLINFPKVRFALAHIGWPWTDECIALAGRFAADVVGEETGLQEHAPRVDAATPYAAQMSIDITLGAPRPYRADALLKALAVVGDCRILYGSDCGDPENAQVLRCHIDLDERLLRGELGQPPETLQRIFHDNFEHFFGGKP